MTVRPAAITAAERRLGVMGRPPADRDAALMQLGYERGAAAEHRQIRELAPPSLLRLLAKPKFTSAGQAIALRELAVLLDGAGT